MKNIIPRAFFPVNIKRSWKQSEKSDLYFFKYSFIIVRVALFMTSLTLFSPKSPWYSFF
jgi:hypothetical protein